MYYNQAYTTAHTTQKGTSSVPKVSSEDLEKSMEANNIRQKINTTYQNAFLLERSWDICQFSKRRPVGANRLSKEIIKEH